MGAPGTLTRCTGCLDACIGARLQWEWRHWCCVFVPSLGHTCHHVCVACSRSPSYRALTSRQALITPGTCGVDCTVPSGPISCQCSPMRPRPALHIRLLRISPIRPAPSCCLRGLVFYALRPDQSSHLSLASHLQHLGSSRYAIATQYSFPIRPQSTCASITSSILCRTAFFADLPVDW